MMPRSITEPGPSSDQDGFFPPNITLSQLDSTDTELSEQFQCVKFRPEAEFPTATFRTLEDNFSMSATIVIGKDCMKTMFKSQTDDDKQYKNFEECLCFFGDNLKISFSELNGGETSNDLFIEYRDIAWVDIYQQDKLHGFLVFHIKSHNYAVVFHSDDMKFLSQVYYTSHCRKGQAHVHDSILRTSEGITKNDRRLTLANFQTVINPINDIWLNSRLNRYDIIPMTCDLLRFWLVVRSSVIWRDWSTEEFKMFDFNDDHLFTKMLKDLTLYYHHPCSEIYHFVDELIGYWKYTGQEQITTFLLHFVQYHVNNLEDIREAVHMPNSIAVLMFRVLTTIGRVQGLNHIFHNALAPSDATRQGLAPINIAIVCLMGLTSLYLKNEPDCKFSAKCLIDGERFQEEMDQMEKLNFRQPETVPMETNEIDLTADSPTSPNAQEQPCCSTGPPSDKFVDILANAQQQPCCSTGPPSDKFVDILVKSCGDMDWFKFHEYLNFAPDGMLSITDMQYQERRDFLTCMYFYTLDCVQQSTPDEIFIDRILNAFPFYDRGMKDLVFRTCLAKIAGTYNLTGLNLPHVTLTGQFQYNLCDSHRTHVNRRLTIREYIQRHFDLQSMINQFCS